VPSVIVIVSPPPPVSVRKPNSSTSLPAVDEPVALRVHHVLDLLAEVGACVDAEGRLGDRDALLVHERVAGHEVPERMARLGDLAQNVPAVAHVGVGDDLALRPLGPVGRGHDAEREVGHARVVVMGDDA
jgi:hypothetical protein